MVRKAQPLRNMIPFIGLLQKPVFSDPLNIYAVGGLAVFLLLLYFVFRYYHERNQLLAELTEKKRVLEIKTRMLDEGNSYGERIQTAILPSPDKVQDIFADHFILFKPKLSVSGDFYWIEQRGGKAMVAVVDCTGHGVPGALMGIIAYDGLNRALLDYELTRADRIISALNEYFTETLRHTGSIDVKDAMDIGLCVINTEKGLLEFTGARSPLYIVRQKANDLFINDEQSINEKTSPPYLFEIRPDRKSVEPTDRAVNFTNNRIKVEKGDVLYLLSDGFADQFGGEEDKKYGYKRLRETLLSIQNLSMREQRRYLEAVLNDWKKKREQVDDITIIGIRIS